MPLAQAMMPCTRRAGMLGHLMHPRQMARSMLAGLDEMNSMKHCQAALFRNFKTQPAALCGINIGVLLGNHPQQCLQRLRSRMPQAAMSQQVYTLGLQGRQQGLIPVSSLRHPQQSIGSRLMLKLLCQASKLPAVANKMKLPAAPYLSGRVQSGQNGQAMQAWTR